MSANDVVMLTMYRNGIELYLLVPRILLLIIHTDLLAAVIPITYWGRHGRDRMVVGFTITYAISVYHD